MAVLRKVNSISKNLICVSNNIIYDNNLSVEARGFLITALYSDYSTLDELYHSCNDTKENIDKYLQELINNKYLVIDNDNYMFFEEPLN